MIDVELDDEQRKIRGRESVTYTNHSPDRLSFLWMQLDPNLFRPDSDDVLTQTAPNLDGSVSFRSLQSMLARTVFDGGVTISEVSDQQNKPLAHTIVKTMMRIDLPEPLGPGETISFHIAWEYAINDSKLVRGRTGFEFFEEDGNCIYEIAQWYPRMVAYTCLLYTSPSPRDS